MSSIKTFKAPQNFQEKIERGKQPSKNASMKSLSIMVQKTSKYATCNKESFVEILQIVKLNG